MAHIFKRDDSEHWQYRRRVPTHLVAKARSQVLTLPVHDTASGEPPFIVRVKVGTEIKFSLRTGNQRSAAEREAQVKLHVERFLSALEAGPQVLTHKQVVALAGRTYRLFIELHEEDPGLPEHWMAVKAYNRAASEGRIRNAPCLKTDEPDSHETAIAVFGADLTAGINAMAPSASREAMEARFGALVDFILVAESIDVDEATRGRLLVEVEKATSQAARTLKRFARSDYSPDPDANRFPEFNKPAASGKGTAVSLKGLVDSWWKEAQPAGRSRSTYDSYRSNMNRLVAFLKHDDAGKVTGADVLRFKDARIAAGINPKTIRDGDLVALKSIFGFAVANHLMRENPATGVTVVRPTRIVTREKGLTSDEAKALLTKAFRHEGGADNAHTTSAKRWIPWLAAYTGARIGELTQLRKRDVARVDGFWTITITPDAGTVKDKEIRRVVLHTHLLEQGFAEFVQRAKEGPLFLYAKPGTVLEGDQLRTKAVALAHRLALFAREVVVDPKVQPNHGFRHAFKTRGREAGIADSVLDAVCGHAPGSIGGSYGNVTLSAQAAAFERFPRYEIEAEPLEITVRGEGRPC